MTNKTEKKVTKRVNKKAEKAIKTTTCNSPVKIDFNNWRHGDIIIMSSTDRIVARFGPYELSQAKQALRRLPSCKLMSWSGGHSSFVDISTTCIEKVKKSSRKKGLARVEKPKTSKKSTTKEKDMKSNINEWVQLRFSQMKSLDQYRLLALNELQAETRSRWSKALAVKPLGIKEVSDMLSLWLDGQAKIAKDWKYLTRFDIIESYFQDVTDHIIYRKPLKHIPSAYSFNPFVGTKWRICSEIPTGCFPATFFSRETNIKKDEIVCWNTANSGNFHQTYEMRHCETVARSYCHDTFSATHKFRHAITCWYSRQADGTIIETRTNQLLARWKLDSNGKEIAERWANKVKNHCYLDKECKVPREPETIIKNHKARMDARENEFDANYKAWLKVKRQRECRC